MRQRLQSSDAAPSCQFVFVFSCCTDVSCCELMTAFALHFGDAASFSLLVCNSCFTDGKLSQGSNGFMAKSRLDHKLSLILLMDKKKKSNRLKIETKQHKIYIQKLIHVYICKQPSTARAESFTAVQHKKVALIRSHCNVCDCVCIRRAGRWTTAFN